MPRKPVILVFSFDLISHYFRSLRIASALKDEYEVYMKWSDKYAYWIKRSGLNTFRCLDFDADTVLKKTGEFDFSWLNAGALETVFLDQVKVIKKYKPTVIIGDTQFSLKMAAEATGIQFLSVLNGYSTRFYKLTRELSPDHPAAPFINWLPVMLLLPLVKIGEARDFRRILKEFNEVRARYKLKRTTHYLEEIAGNENVICDLPEIFPQNKLPDNYHFIGPLFYKPEMNGSNILEQLDPGKKTILVTMGSSGEWNRLRFLNREEFSVYNIIVAGDENSVMNAPFLLKTPFVDFHEVLPRVDLVICHGGNGTLNHALLHNVPALCYHSNLEQTWNVQRIEEMGFGKSLYNTNSKDIPGVLMEWVERKSRIRWDLSFDAFNNDFQNKLLFKIIGNLK